MKIAVQIFNHSAMLRTAAMSQFRFIYRSASLTSCLRSHEGLQLRSPPSPSNLPLSFSHSRMCGIASSWTSYPKLSPPSRLMSCRPPPTVCSNKSVTLTDDEKLTLVKAEYELYKAEGEVEIPSHIQEQDWLELTRLPSVMARKKYLRFLFIKEMKKINKKEKGSKKRAFSNEKHAQVLEELTTEEGRLTYGLWRNAMFIKWLKQNINDIESHKLIQAKLYGQPIVFDYDFDEYMVSREKKALAKQVCECIGNNRSHREPFYIHMCNFRQEEEIAKTTLKAIPPLLHDDFLVDVHSEDYLDVFPKDKLVYLTPHCRDEVGDFDHDAVYIIGGFIDTRNNVPITLAKAKKQNIKMRKLPLDRYLDWGIGKKSLTLNHVLGIMLEMKRSGSWERAFEMHIPSRNLVKAQPVDGAAIKRKMRRSQDEQVTGRLVRSWFRD
ncbi:tRNA methyltransferase TRMD/TRM10-type domain [Trinorchestia longiramus]|nr:tRNA methyltransferase TRMD/TRM10-type domain [Trinorchestia longiramus]